MLILYHNRASVLRVQQGRLVQQSHQFLVYSEGPHGAGYLHLHRIPEDVYLLAASMELALLQVDSWDKGGKN